MHETNLDIRAINKELRRGNSHAFEEILNHYEKRVLRWVSFHIPRADIQDVSQEAFLELYKALPGYKEQGNFTAYIKCITIRTCYAYFRKKQNRAQISLSSYAQNHQELLDKLQAGQIRDIDEIRQEKEGLSEFLGVLLARLKPLDRMLLELVYFQDYSVKESAKLLGISYPNAKIRSFRARTRLREFIQASGGS